VALTKPTVDAGTWGNTNTSSPDMVTPGAGLVNTGFLAPPTLPKRGHMNWLLNKLHQGLRYYMAQGLPAWDASETQYIVGSFVMFGGLGYRCKTATPAGTDPTVDTAHWELMVLPQPGSLLRVSVITATSTLAKQAGTTRARFRMVGAGAGSAGVWGGGGPRREGSGGAGSGSWAEFETTNIPATWSFTLNAAGTGGAIPVDPEGAATAYTSGTNGGTTVLDDGVNTFTCPGGTASTGIVGGAGGVIPTATGGTIILACPGQDGDDGSGVDAFYAVPVRAGRGGSTPFGSGGKGLVYPSLSETPGTAGTGYGSGAGGATATSTTGKAGGLGKKGLILLEEWS
jgi:hypothetical protein